VTLFGASVFLCFLPFMLVVGSIAGRDVAAGLTRHLGLSAQAADQVRSLFRTSRPGSGVTTVWAVAVSTVSGMGTASTLQRLYERLFDLAGLGRRNALRQLAWVATIVGAAFLVGSLRPPGAQLLTGIAAVVLTLLVCVATLWLLVGGRVRLHQLVGPAVATSLLLVGLHTVSGRIFSRLVIENSHKYGPIGAAFALAGYGIALGFVIVLGGVIGIAVQEHGATLRTVAARLRRSRSTTGRGGAAPAKPAAPGDTAELGDRTDPKGTTPSARSGAPSDVPVEDRRTGSAVHESAYSSPGAAGLASKNGS
jgi:membrane protein